MGREVAVGFVDDDDAGESGKHLEHLIAVDGIAGGIVGRTDPDELGVLVGGCQQLVGMHLIVLVEQHGAILDVVDVGTYLVHAVGGLDGYDIVFSRFTEDAIGQVDGLVAAIAQENHLCRDAFLFGYLLFQFTLQRVRIAVKGRIVWILVGIEEHMCLMAGIFIACAAIGSKAPDVWSD